MAMTRHVAVPSTPPPATVDPLETICPCPRPYRQEQSDTEKTPGQAYPTDPQSASPLFKAPPEIRDMIFKLALTSYDDVTRTDWHARKNCAHHLRTDTDLLRTCRRVYDETALLPVSINAHFLRLHHISRLSCRRPIGQSAFTRMNPAQLAAVRHVHVFAAHCSPPAMEARRETNYSGADLDRLSGNEGRREGERKAAFGIEGLHPKMLTFTVGRCQLKWWLYARLGIEKIIGMIYGDFGDDETGK